MIEYKKGEWYEGLGKYIGIFNVYPNNKKYYMKVYKFVGKLPEDGRGCGKVTEIEFDRINRADS